MTQILAIEFDFKHYPNKIDCINWLQQSLWSDLLQVKSFRLRTNTNARYLTQERKRAVWRYDIGVAKAEGVRWIRPSPYIIVGTQYGEKWPSTDIPPLLEETIKHETEKKERFTARINELRAQRAEKARLNPKPPKPKKEPKKREYKPRTNRKKPVPETPVTDMVGQFR